MGAAQSTRKITLVDDDKAGVIKLSESLAHRLRGQIEGQQGAPAERTSPAAIQEPLPPPPFHPPPHPSVPLPQHSFTERPLPVIPEPPRVADVAPIPTVPEPTPPKAPTPETEPRTLGQPDAPAANVPGPLTLPVPHQVEDIPSSSRERPTAPDVGIAIKAGAGPTLVQPSGSIPPWSIYAEEAHLMVMRLREEKEQEIKKVHQEWREKMDARELEFTKMARLSEEEVSNALKEVENLFMKASCTPVCQGQQEKVMNCYQDHPRQSLRCAREVEHFTECVDLSRLQSIMKQEIH